jgi:N utilization substance protein B
MDLCRLSYADASDMIWSQSEEPDKIRVFSAKLASGASDNMPRIESLIVQYAENWELSRMAVIDRNILRLSAYELIWCTETPVSVIIDEAVEIAKAFSTADSGKFVNGILDKIKEERSSSPHD